MSSTDESLADEAQSLLAAYRADEGLPADVRARVLARVNHSVDAPGAGSGVVTLPRRGVRMTVIGLALAAGIAALWFGRDLVSPTQVATPSSASHERAHATTHVAEEHEADVDATSTTPIPATPPSPTIVPPSAAVADEPAAKPSTPSATRKATPTPAIEIDAFADETELLRAAQAARARGDSRHALALLDAGARRFATGALAEERAALHVLALCDLGRRSRARREADAFATTYPGSPLLGRVRTACVEESPDAP